MPRKKQRLTTEATWWVQLNAPCPNCNAHLDLYEIKDHDELPSPCTSDDDTDIIVNCPECESVFTVTQVTW